MQVVMTRGIAAKMNADREFTEFIEQSLRRYFNRDWGDTCKEDWKMNDNALKYKNDRIVASYNEIFIITEHDHSVTTILLKEEY